MGGGYTPAPDAGDSLAPIVRRFGQVQRELKDVQRPGKTNLVALYDQVQQALANINATVSAAIAANSYTKAEIDSRDSSTLASANAFTTAGFTASGGISAADLYARNAPGFNITATRVAAWLQSSDGRLGTATSSELNKTNIRPVPLADLIGILEIDVSYFEYIAEVRKRDDPSFEGYVGPEYHVATNIGSIAQRLHEAGLWQFVVYERAPILQDVVITHEDGTQEEQAVAVGDRLKVDENGEPIPLGVHDNLLAYALIPVVQDHERRIQQLEQGATP
jgi:hypothetical protein